MAIRYECCYQIASRMQSRQRYDTQCRIDGCDSVRRALLNRMLRVGYPATLPVELFRDFPSGIELIPVSDKMDHDVDIDVWIPDPYSTGPSALGRDCAA